MSYNKKKRQNVNTLKCHCWEKCREGEKCLMFGFTKKSGQCYYGQNKDEEKERLEIRP